MIMTFIQTSVLGKRSQECRNTTVNEHRPVKYTNKAGVTFTVTLVNPQVVKTLCPICSEDVITANPICTFSRYHVVCSTCLPKIFDDKSSSRCPECNKSNTKANYEQIKELARDNARELNCADISCDSISCSFTAFFSDIESHIHDYNPSKSPFYFPPFLSETVNPFNGHIDEEIESIAESLTLQLPYIHESNYLFMGLGVSREELDYISSQAHVRNATLPKAATFKAKMIFSMKKRKKIKNPINEQEIRKLLEYVTDSNCSGSLGKLIKWPTHLP